MSSQPLSPQHQLMQMITAKWLAKPIHLAAELGLADILAQRPLTTDELADRCGVHAPSLARVMRALAGVGIFSRDDVGRHRLTPLAEPLRQGAMQAAARMFNADWNDAAWMELPRAVRSGETAFELAHGAPLAEWLADHPEATRLLTEANAFKAAVSHRVITEVYDFSAIDFLTDVGGGSGQLLVAIARANPRLRGLAADLPEVVPLARELFREQSLDHRLAAGECDFFQAVPSGGRAMLLSHVLHDWPDDSCRTILANCRAALPPDGLLLVVEMVVPEGEGFSLAKLLDLEMMVITGGRERTEQEYRSLLASAGFRLERVLSAPGEISVLEARPV